MAKKSPKAPAAGDTPPPPLLTDFAADPPHEAASGEYSFCVRDRWFGFDTGLPDAWHGLPETDWLIRTDAGLPVEALRRDHPRCLAMAA